MPKNLIIRRSANSSLKLNEGLGERGGYILEGIFAELDTLNRNKRIYPKDEYLKHLQYLRDDLKNGEPILGELDHPDDRFEVKLKEASHRIIDLWYDSNDNTVKGKIELLDTPNGKIAKSLVDQGVPLHISSRAAGTVGSDSKVSIQQIYTYDLVCKPGFAGAVLHRVNESADNKTYDETVMKFLAESEKNEAEQSAKNSADKFGLLNEEVSVVETSAEINLRQNEKNQDNNTDMNKVTNESELDEKKVSIEKEKQELKSVFEKDDKEGKDEDDSSDSGDEGDSKGDDDNEDKGVEILDVKAVTTDDEDKEKDKDDVEIKDVEGKTSDDGEKNDDESSEESSDDEDKENEESNEAKTDECGDAASEGDGENCGDADKCDTKNALFDCKELKDKKESFLDDIDDRIEELKRKSESSKKNESETISKYPGSALLSKENFKEFASLTEAQKRNVADYLADNRINTPEAINENWKSGIEYKKVTEAWLEHAPADYKRLFESAPESVKDSIRKTASFCLFENQRDVNRFWENTGLVEAQQRKMLNENFINNLPKINESVSVKEELPYSKGFIQMIADMASEYNK